MIRAVYLQCVFGGAFADPDQTPQSEPSLFAYRMYYLNLNESFTKQPLKRNGLAY